MTEYDARTALVVVDVQNDFADPKGSLYVRGGEDVVPLINDQIDKARLAGALVVYSRDWHPETTPHFHKDGGVWPVHCVADTWGSQFYPSLTVVAGSEVIHKGVGGEDGYSAFSVRDPRSGDISSTRLDTTLRAHGIERVVVAGLATDYCVKETVLDALHLGFAVEVLTRGVRAVDLQPGDGARALEALAAAGSRLI